jgi:predicted negative regulator of RcsB-dependent stress response
MAHLDLHEQEQLSKLKHFWRDYGKYLIGLVVVVFIAYCSLLAWESHSQRQSEQASKLYMQLVKALNTPGNGNSKNIIAQLQRDYPKTEYTTMATLIVAKNLVTSADLEQAQKYLQWVVDNSKDKGFVAIAKLKLADVYMDRGNFNDALNIVAATDVKSFEPLFIEKRGDIYLAKGDKDMAKKVYNEALQKSEDGSVVSQELRFKLSLLGN